MKRTLLAIALCAAAGCAWADYYDDDTLPPVVVPHIDGGRIVADCTPPNGDDACAAFHELIRENFTPNEIALLVGPATAYPDYITNYSRAQEHYAAFLRDIEENGMPVPVAYERE